MDKNLQNLLFDLEPTIDKKCFELKQKRKEKRMQKIFIVAIILILFIPSTLILFGIHLWGIMIGIIAVLSIAMIAMLPIALKEEGGGVCYE